MNKRKLIIIGISIGVIALGIVLQQIFQAQKEEPEKKISPERVRFAKTDTAEYKSYQTKIVVHGGLRANNKIQVVAEASGTVMETGKEFRIGNFFSSGDLMIEIDPRDAELNVRSLKGDMLSLLASIMPDIKADYPDEYPKWLNYLDGFEIDKDIQPLPEPGSKKLKYFLAGRNIYKLFYSVKMAELRLSKCFVRAPFSGVVSMSSIEPGMMVRVGQVLGEFAGIDYFEMQTSVKVADLEHISVGNKAKLFSSEMEGEWLGKIIRIGKSIDPRSQTTPVFISASGKGLIDGLYLSAEIYGNRIDSVFKIPRKAITDDESVYMIEKDSVLASNKVEVVRYEEDMCFVRGVEKNSVIVIEPLVSPKVGAIYKPISNK